MTTTRILISDIDVRLAWDLQDPNEGISQQADVGDVQPIYEFGTGTGVGQHNSAWYSEITVSGNNSHTFDLTSLPTKLVGITINRSFVNIKSIVIENLSGSGHLLVGSSGTADSLTFFGELSEIGHNGIIETTSEIGYDVDSSHKNLKITNSHDVDIQCKVLVLGVYGI
jgi:hypothetical protein